MKSHVLLFVYILLYFEILFCVISVFSFTSFFLIVFHLCLISDMFHLCLVVNPALDCSHLSSLPWCINSPCLPLSLLDHYLDEKLKSHNKSKVNN